MATLTTQVVNNAGAIITPVAAAGGGDAMACGATNILRVVNGGGSPITVTTVVPAGRTYKANVAITSPVISVSNGTTKDIGPIDGVTFQDPTTGLCTITYSGVTSVTVAAIQLAQG
jgi:hypothetical protein